MKNSIVILVLLISLTGYSQKSINDYSFVVVPENFEFLGENDKYELNSMTNFLLKKYGFNSYMENELPNVKRCDGVYADVLKKNHMLRTKLTLVIKDCNGNLLFQAEEGNSKEKDFRKSYQDALRKTFRSLSKMNVSQSSMMVFEENSQPNVSEEMLPNVDNSVGVNDNSEIKEAPNSEINKMKESKKETLKVIESPKFPESKFSSYTHNETPYLLRKTKVGYSLYEETDTAEDGLLLVGELIFNEQGGILTQSTTGKVFTASFDASENLVIENEDTMLRYVALH
ncbi:hypothetical protein [Cochleicola gelatinilyticus]|uniref:Uncharacterized protein n=1 Tax=Cochleicola gelatinilyticus TaxID=1763537 RepID=A0A167IG39_9FLAO|nr:hypothetical protein [Cochleicola gelatinilyticus]OAB79618.1 hypothetical protein ULVI_02360 [Cochleicola gelatinilyticus]